MRHRERKLADDFDRMAERENEQRFSGADTLLALYPEPIGRGISKNAEKESMGGKNYRAIHPNF